MLGIEKLQQARALLEKDLSLMLTRFEFEPKLARIIIFLRDGTIIHIRYNNHDEYSYSIFFSIHTNDRCRFDNYDDRWNVISTPHHFHPRFDKNGYESPMNGDPLQDIPILCNLLIEGKLLDTKIRFLGMY